MCLSGRSIMGILFSSVVVLYLAVSHSTDPALLTDAVVLVGVFSLVTEKFSYPTSSKAT